MLISIGPPRNSSAKACMLAFRATTSSSSPPTAVPAPILGPSRGWRLASAPRSDSCFRSATCRVTSTSRGTRISKPKTGRRLVDLGQLRPFAEGAEAADGETDRPQVLSEVIRSGTLWKTLLPLRDSSHFGLVSDLDRHAVCGGGTVRRIDAGLSQFQPRFDITRQAASTFIDKVAQLGAGRIDLKFRNVRDSSGNSRGPSLDFNRQRSRTIRGCEAKA